jgi:cell wall-associated NlpC family hydrolase
MSRHLIKVIGIILILAVIIPVIFVAPPVNAQDKAQNDNAEDLLVDVKYIAEKNHGTATPQKFWIFTYGIDITINDISNSYLRFLAFNIENNKVMMKQSILMNDFGLTKEQVSMTANVETEEIEEAEVSVTADEVIEFAKLFIGKVGYGGGEVDEIDPDKPPKTLDCSAFVGSVYLTATGIKLERVTVDQFNQGSKVNKGDLQPGDLVFFDTDPKKIPGHVGIYIGDNQFIHSGVRTGVTISNIDDSYWGPKYYGATRIL